jgi:pyrroloquinoline quinone biosynthesis protein B
LSSGRDGQFLINASPDLRLQIEAEPDLRPLLTHGIRNTPIAGIVLTSADLDQVLGLLLLREFQPLRVYATPLVRGVLEANSFFRMMERVPNQLTWVEILSGVTFPLNRDIACTPIPLKGSLPHYAHELNNAGSPKHANQASIGLLIESEGRRIAYTPSLPEITGELRDLYSSSDVILVDGTFWSDTELSQIQEGAPLARSIGHVPMSGEDGSLAQLADVTAPKKVFIHINNTNPVLDLRSQERKANPKVTC